MTGTPEGQMGDLPEFRPSRDRKDSREGRRARRPPLARLAPTAIVVASLMTVACGAGANDVTLEPFTTEFLAPTTSTLPPATTTTLPELNPRGPCMGRLSLDQRIGQLIMVLTPNVRSAAELARNGGIGGIGVLGQPGAAIKGDIQAVQQESRLPLFISGDEEGGTVQHLRRILGILPSQRDLAKTKTTAQVTDIWTRYATAMRETGFNMNFGPTLDVGFGPAIKSRSFSLDPQVAADYGLATIAGWEAGGIIPVVKHWPGIGYSTTDPHKAVATRVPGLDVLKNREFIPFEKVIEGGAPMVMVTHALIPAVNETEPASISERAISVLRDDLGFGGIIITDSLGMGAVSKDHSQGESAELALKAGVDIVMINDPSLVPAVQLQIMDAVRTGRLSEDRVDASAKKVLDLKGIKGDCPAPGDSAAAGAVSAGGETTTTLFRRLPTPTVTTTPPTTSSSTTSIAGTTAEAGKPTGTTTP